LPEQLKPFFTDQINRVRILHEQDLRNGLGGVYLPDALERNKDVSTTMIYTHVMKRGGMGVKSPLDTRG